MGCGSTSALGDPGQYRMLRSVRVPPQRPDPPLALEGRTRLEPSNRRDCTGTAPAAGAQRRRRWRRWPKRARGPGQSMGCGSTSALGDPGQYRMLRSVRVPPQRPDPPLALEGRTRLEPSNRRDCTGTAPAAGAQRRRRWRRWPKRARGPGQSMGSGSSPALGDSGQYRMPGFSRRLR